MDLQPQSCEPLETAGLPTLPGYTILGCLGAGSMGSVFKARHEALNRYVAIKVITPGVFETSCAVRRFLNEARAVAKLNHLNIIRAYDLIERDGHFFFVMEYFKSESLSAFMKRKPGLSCQDCARIILQMACALNHSSSHGIVHRDVKPANILVSGNLLAKLTDFGLAQERTRMEDADPGDEPGLVGVSAGTPSYMSPEQIVSSSQVDVRSDIYSLGLCFYFALERRDAYSGDVSKIIMAQLKDPLPPFTSRAVPTRVRTVLERMTAKSPEDRFPHTAELILTLRTLTG